MKFGWRRDLEDRRFLYQNARHFELLKFGEIPDKVDPRGHIKIKNQLSLGACAGFSRSYCMEALYNGIGKQGIEFSPMFAYLSGQAIDGILGRDVGASISGGVKASTKYGNCEEHIFPYTGEYTTKVPNGSLENAEKQQLLSHAPVSSADECRQAIGSGYPIYLGIQWNDSLDSAIVDRYDSRNSTGGHAVCLLGYEGDYFFMANSWGDRWGNKGWAKWHIRAVENMIRSKYSEFFMVSEIEKPVPKSWNYDNLILG